MSGKPKILIVDDSPTVRMRCRMVLTAEGYETLEAEDGAEAMKLARERFDIGLILADINMPNMNGLEMLKELSRRGVVPRVPVVMVTTESASALILQARTLGAKGWIVKPVDSEVLLKTVRQFIE